MTYLTHLRVSSRLTSSPPYGLEASMTDYKAALHRIETRAINTCSACGRSDIAWGQPLIVGLPTIIDGAPSADEGAEALAYVCNNCGHIRLFTTQQLLDDDH
jgi:hypothetical protein